MEIDEAKLQLQLKVNKIVGHNVIGLGDILSIITGPDVLPQLEVLIDAVRNDSHKKHGL